MNRLKTRFIFPDHLAPSELDQYLAKGWYRMGTAVFTTHFLTIFGFMVAAFAGGFYVQQTAAQVDAEQQPV